MLDLLRKHGLFHLAGGYETFFKNTSDFRNTRMLDGNQVTGVGMIGGLQRWGTLECLV